MIMYYQRFPYKEEVTGSNPVAPTRVVQKSLHIYSQKPHKFSKTVTNKRNFLMYKP